MKIYRILKLRLYFYNKIIDEGMFILYLFYELLSLSTFELWNTLFLKGYQLKNKKVNRCLYLYSKLILPYVCVHPKKSSFVDYRHSFTSAQRLKKSVYLLLSNSKGSLLPKEEMGEEEV